jgi:hypothetical protein
MEHLGLGWIEVLHGGVGGGRSRRHASHESGSVHLAGGTRDANVADELVWHATGSGAGLAGIMRHAGRGHGMARRRAGMLLHPCGMRREAGSHAGHHLRERPVMHRADDDSRAWALSHAMLGTDRWEARASRGAAVGSAVGRVGARAAGEKRRVVWAKMRVEHGGSRASEQLRGLCAARIDTATMSRAVGWMGSETATRWERMAAAASGATCDASTVAKPTAAEQATGVWAKKKAAGPAKCSEQVSERVEGQAQDYATTAQGVKKRWALGW